MTLDSSTVFALDFDGVLCDSAVECAVTAWRAGREIWRDWQPEEPAAEIVARFVELRPLVETGYQCIPLLKLISDGYSGERIRQGFVELCDDVIQRSRGTRETYSLLFAKTRDQWITNDLGDWLGRHRFYPPVLDKLAEAQSKHPVYILTTKSERFVKLLLQRQQLSFADERVFGLDRKEPKEATLVRLLGRYSGATVHFVEDRLATLLRVVANNRLDSVRLYLANWGYNTVDDRAVAARHERIVAWGLESFLDVKCAN